MSILLQACGNPWLRPWVAREAYNLSQGSAHTVAEVGSCCRATGHSGLLHSGLLRSVATAQRLCAVAAPWSVALVAVVWMSHSSLVAVVCMCPTACNPIPKPRAFPLGVWRDPSQVWPIIPWGVIMLTGHTCAQVASGLQMALYMPDPGLGWPV